MASLRSRHPTTPSRRALAPDHPRRSRVRTVRFDTVRSADGTVIETWTNQGQGPTVLLCNGLASNAYAWPELLKADCGLRVISWNHRGVGRSLRPDDPEAVGVEEFVQDAVAVLDAAGVESCVLMGWSFGVNVAFELAAQHPERVTGVLAVAGVPGDSFESMGAPLLVPRVLRRRLALAGAVTARTAGPVLSRIATRVPMGPLSTTALRFSGLMLPTARFTDVRRTTREFLTTPVEWYFHLAIRGGAHDQVPLAEISVPTAFLAGRFDLVASARDMRNAAAQVDGAVFREVLGTHFVPLERAGTVMTMLRELVEVVHGPPT